MTLAIGAGDDHFRARGGAAGFGEHIAAWRPRQGDIEQHRGDGLGWIADEVQRGGSIGGFDDRHPSAAKHLHDSPAKGRFILHDQDGSGVAPFVRRPTKRRAVRRAQPRRL